MDIAEINRQVIEQFRAGGPIEGMQREKLLLLTTTGRRTGLERITPMMFHRCGGRLLVVASNAGAPRHPDWYLNLLADPHVTVEVGDEHFAAVAVITTDNDREHLWRELKETYSFFADHEATAHRTIPVVALEETTTRQAVPGRRARLGRQPR